jgi:hypothetical protein
MKNLKLSFYIKTEKRTNRGVAPIICKIRINGTTTTLSTGYKVSPVRWKGTKQFKISRDIQEKSIRCKLDNMRGEIETIEKKMSETAKTINALIIKKIYLGGNVIEEIKEKTLTDAFELHNEEFKTQVDLKERSKDTLGKYVRVHNYYKEYVSQEYDIKDIGLNKLVYDFNLLKESRLLHKGV